jgi:branched-chain amino acid transport system ATP-binding protein
VTTPTPEPVLVVESIASGYGDLQVLRQVSVQVWPGRISVLLGSNGAGKTTTLRAVAGLNRVVAGSVRLLGRDVTSLPAPARVRMGLGFVMEGKRLFHRRTVEDNLLLGGYSKLRSRRALRHQADTMYDRFPMLGERRRSRAGELSGGQQQMLAIAQALMAQPKVLLLDEPSAGLAPVIVRQVLAIVEELKSEGLGVLLVEQAAEEAVRIADHVTVLDVGRVVIDRPAAEIEDVSVIRSAYLGGGRDRPAAPTAPPPEPPAA